MSQTAKVQISALSAVTINAGAKELKWCSLLNHLKSENTWTTEANATLHWIHAASEKGRLPWTRCSRKCCCLLRHSVLWHSTLSRHGNDIQTLTKFNASKDYTCLQ